MSELRRLLAVKLGAANWHKVSRCLPRKIDGEPYRQAVTDLATAKKIAFPPRVDMTKIDNCCQKREESIQDYFVRLHETFNKHSGLDEPSDRLGHVTCEAVF